MSVLTRLSIGKKLALGCGIIVAVSLFGSVFSLSKIQQVDFDVRRLDRVMSRVMVAYNLRFQSLSIMTCMLRFQNPLTSRQEFVAQYPILDDFFVQVVSNLDYYPTLGVNGKLASEEESKYFADYKAAFYAQLTNARKLRAYAAEVENEEDHAYLMRDMFVNKLQAPVARARVDATAAKLLDYIDGYSDTTFKGAIEDVSKIVDATLIVLTIVLVSGISVSLLLSRSITRTSSSLAATLHSNSDFINSSSRELASGSQALASGASEQAASVEEISASLEEIASMIKQNADNAAQASKLTAAASETVDATNKAMQRSLAANEEIAKASNETSKIIKTIDEIAFQTNLLSLNAAVEAARAGEAGAGFAVVAGEVRGLSMRSAEASKRTAEMIEQTISKVQEGIEIFNETEKYIGEVVDQTHKIRQLIDEVAAASGEQTKGVEQINKGVSEMEKVTQQNAANSEQSAAASEGLRGQVETMMATVLNFEAFIHGGGNASSGGKAPGGGPRKSETKTQPAGAAAPKKAQTAAKPPEAKAQEKAGQSKPAAHHPPTAHRPTHIKKDGAAPEQVIPLDDDDMKDF